jgi:hypothetical protein
MSISPRQRMLAAYQGTASDRIPVAPEFWYYIPARLLNIPMYQLELEVPHWQALHQTFKHYACEGWGIVQPGRPQGWGYPETHHLRRISEDRLEELALIEGDNFTLTARTLYDRFEPSWQTERYVKNFDLDWPVYECQSLVPPDELDWAVVQNALDAVGDDYLLEVYVGLPFIDFAGGQREGGLEQVIADLYDRTAEMQEIQERYIAYMAEITRTAFQMTTARSVFVASIWSTLSLLSPSLWRKWDKPVLEAVVKAAHEAGGLVHHHFHGKCRNILPELASLGLDCICPFERPPGGDITNLEEVRRFLGENTTFNGNVGTVETLIKGTTEDVRREVVQILDAFQGSNRLIVGTGDQVGYETPDDNIHAMINSVKEN